MDRIRDRIESRSNPLVKKFQGVIAGKIDEFFLVEGIRLLEEGVKAKFSLEVVFCSDVLAKNNRGKELLFSLEKRGVRLFIGKPSLIAAVSDVETSQGIVALARRPTSSISSLFQGKVNPFLLVAAGIRDPGNLGSLIRTADAAGVDGVVVCEGAASPFNSKAVRSTMGSIFRLPVFGKVPVEDIVAALKKHKFRLVATDSHSGVEFRDASYLGPIALCLGAEADGIPKVIRDKADLTVQVRLSHGVESLNVAAAGAILLFEIAGQRRAR